jgi:hypothetical protein
MAAATAHARGLLRTFGPDLALSSVSRKVRDPVFFPRVPFLSGRPAAGFSRAGLRALPSGIHRAAMGKCRFTLSSCA